MADRQGACLLGADAAAREVLEETGASQLPWLTSLPLGISFPADCPRPAVAEQLSLVEFLLQTNPSVSLISFNASSGTGR